MTRIRSIGVLLFLLSALAVVPAPATEIPFGGERIAAFQETPAGVITADLDGDGDEDLLGYSSLLAAVGGVWWYENLDGLGSFGPGTQISNNGSLNQTGAISAVDIDGDGDLDLVEMAVNSIYWYENTDGDGTFGSQNLITTGFIHNGIDIGDIDGDGDPDLVTAQSNSNRVDWVENLGGGSFGNPSSNRQLIGSLSSPRDASLTDVDGDGDLDVFACVFNTIVWYENTDGAGTFGPSQTVHDLSSQNFYEVNSGDIDGDGDMDAISAAWSVQTVWWHDNTAGDGSAWTSVAIGTLGNGLWQTVPVDMDLDGDLDVVAQSLSSDLVAWFENRAGDGSVWSYRPVSSALDSPDSVDVGDLDGDGDPDVVSLSNVDGKISWFENRTIHRNALYPAEGLLGSQDSPMAVRAADLDGDGDVDVAAASRIDDTIAWYENDGGPTPGWTPRNVTTSIDGPTSLHLTDIDGDGDVDVVSGAWFPGGTPLLAWYENNGASPPAWTPRTIMTSPEDPTYVSAADFDGDGDMDVLFAGADTTSATIAWYENDGGSPPGWTERDIVVRSGVVGIAKMTQAEPADVDGDGDMDVMAVSPGDPLTAWFENDGGSPPAWTEHSISSTFDVWSISPADVDGDGDIDALRGTLNGAGTVEWFENDGGSPPDWTFRNITTSFDSPRRLLGADLDDDGDTDVLVADWLGDTIAWMENDGASPPGWKLRTIVNSAHQPFTVFAADLDADGDLDALLGSSEGDTVTWYENRGGQFGMLGSDGGDGTAPEGETTSLLAATVELNGRPGDSVGRLGTIDLLFEDTGSTALSSAQANALIDNLLVYRDTGSGAFEPTEDVLVETVATLTLTDGVAALPLPAGDPNVLVAAPATFFVVGEMTDDASAQSPSDFKVTQLSESGSTAFDASAGIELSRQHSPDFQSQTISAVGRFVVDSLTDAGDANPGDGFCDDGAGNCTLRAAVQEANAFDGDNRIFLPAGGYILTLAGAGEDAALTGDLDITDVGDLTKIVGSGADNTVLDVGGIDRAIEVHSGAILELEDISLTGGFLSGAPNRGGAISNNGGTLTITRCEMYGNQANVAGAVDSLSGTTVIEGSTLYDNIGFQNGAVQEFGGNTTLRNSTITGNTGSGGGSGSGGIGNLGNGTLTVDGCTVTGNRSEALRNFGSGTFNVRNTVVFGNTVDDAQGTFVSQGFNVVGTLNGSGFTDGVNDDQVGVADAGLGPLGDNGGSTQTHDLLPDSPAIDAGSCGSLTLDQRGERRPVDVPGAANVDDGCDVGSYESKSGPTQSRVEIPVRWCGLRGAPSIEDPSLVGETSVNDVLRKRHERSSDNIYTPLANIGFRSAGNVVTEDYPLLEDPDCVEGPPGTFTCDVGQRGDVFVDLDEANFEEFQFLVAACRRAWETQDPDIQGITAIQINRFVDASGTALDILGVGGRAGLSVDTEQSMGGRVMVVDNVYRLDVPANPDVPNPPDAIDRLLSHEMGHALSLQHGDGVDNDNDGELDNDDDGAAGLPRFDGPNLMQYRNGTELTVAQIEQARNHMDDALPDVDVQPLTDAVAAEAPIQPETRKILQFGYDGLTELENRRILQFENASVLQFENRKILQFENRKILQFENRKILQFENKRILQFGMDYDGTLASNRTRVSGSMGSLPWPAAIRPTTRYFFYLDLDRNDATGAYPPHFANPELPGSNFPGSNNFVGAPDVTEEAGIDLIAQIELTSSCPGESCSSTAEMKVFDFNDGTGEYELVLTDPDPDLTAIGVELYVDNGGQAVDEDNIPTELVIQPELDNSILFAAGWGFATPGGGGAAVPQRVRMELVTTVECEGNVLNDDPSSAAVNCQCTDCADCPDYPGCTGVIGTPKTLQGPTILTDCKLGELTFEPPLLPSCVSIPQLAEEGSFLTVRVTDLPDDVTGTVEVVVGDSVVGTQAIAPFDGGSVNVNVFLPSGVTGPVRLSTGIVGLAPRADCIVDVTPTLLCDDNDGDGVCNTTDPDDDNDSVVDASDTSPLNPFVCADTDLDGCDDCSSGTAAPFEDGPDYDLDGLCDAGDPDDDNDGIPDGSDGDPLNANTCGDSDGDRCDDCINGFPGDPADDGPDFDLDGQCDFGDLDDDNDGTIDQADCAPNDGSLRTAPTAVTGVRVEADKVRVSWDSPQAAFGSATLTDVLRGVLAELPVGGGASEVCLADDDTDDFIDDNPAIGAGEGFWYLIRATNACGAGGYGTDGEGTERVSPVCP